MKTRRLFTVERLESRDTPSAMLLSSVHAATPAVIRGYEDPEPRSVRVQTSRRDGSRRTRRLQPAARPADDAGHHRHLNGP